MQNHSALPFAIVMMLSFASPIAAQTTALTHANVVDVETGAIRRDQTIIIQRSTIKTIGGPATPIPRGASVTDLRGGYVIPGLWDMHTHLGSTGRTALALYIANGITGVRDMGSIRGVVRPWRDSIESGKLIGPRILLAGPIIERASWLDAVRGYARRIGDAVLAEDLAGRIPINTPATARKAVDSVIALGADFLKIRNDPVPVALFALLRRAREKNIPVAGHWPSATSPAEASDSGFRSLEHGALSVANGQLGPTLERMSADERRALFARFARNGTAYTPTLISLKGFRLTPDSIIARVLNDTAGAIDPRMRYIDRSLVSGWKTDFKLKASETPPLDWNAFSKSWNRDLREMADAKVLLLAGTDAASPLVFTGFALAEELEAMMKEAGLTPLQSLQTATLNVAKWMRDEQSFGTVAAGKRADLTVLDGNPLDDIRNVARVRAVIRNGRLFDRAALDMLLRSVEAAVRAGKPRLIALDTSYAGVIDRAYGALDAQQWSDAIELFQKAIAVNPYVADHWYGLGRAFYNSNRQKESIGPFERAFQLGGGRRFNAAWNIARAYAHEGQRDEAMQWLARSLELGYRSREVMRQDTEFEKYRNDPRFKELTDSVDLTKLSKADGRKHDVELMIAEVRRMHKDPDRTIAFVEFERKAQELIPRLGSLTDNEFAVAIQRLLATLGSGHSGSTPESIPWWADKAVPLQFFDFADGLRIVAADSAFSDLVGAQVTQAASRDIAQVRAAIDSITSKDHPLGRASFTRWLRYPQLLNGMRMNPTPDTLPLTVITSAGETRSIKVATRSTGTGYLRFAGRPEWIQAHVKFAPEVPLYLRNREGAYSFTLLPSERTLYFQFNSVRNAGVEPFDIFVQRMFETADSAGAQRLVIDLRWNYGGNTALVTPLLRAVLARERFVRRGGLFVIIGRITNSAAQNAVTLLERYANPILVGEVTGSAPNFVGEDNFITLPYSKMAVGISDLYWQASWPQDERVWTAPLLYTPPTWEAYRRGRDPAMEAIRAYRR